VNAAGEVIGRASVPDGEAAEAENDSALAAAVAGARSAGSIRGGGVIERDAVSGAEALLRTYAATPGELTVCIDLDGPPSGCVAAGAERSLAFQPAALRPEPWLLSPRALAELARSLAAEEGSPLAAISAADPEPWVMIAEAEAEGDVAAQRAIDSVSDGLAAFLASAARLLMPERLLFAPAAHVRPLLRMEDVRRRVRRLLPADLAARVALGAIDASVESRLIGIGLEGIDRWLRKLESG
jgi:hypothetical protein